MIFKVNHYKNGVAVYFFNTRQEAERFYKMTQNLKCDSTIKGRYVHVSD